MTDNETILASLRSTLDDAIREGDARAESVARVNIACGLLQMGSEEAFTEFEEALAAVRRAQNPRSEAILSTFFAPSFVERGDPSRALALAVRGQEIAARGQRGQRVLSLINLARVLYTGFSDVERGGETLDQALTQLAQGEIESPTSAAAVSEAILAAASAALEAGDTQRALAIMRIVDPESVAGIGDPSAHDDPGPAPDQDSEMDRLYDRWRRRHASDPGRRVAEMDEKVSGLLGWGPSRAGLSGACDDPDSVRQFVREVQAVGRGVRRTADGGGPSLTDDDLVFVLGLATDPEYSQSLPAAAVFEMVGSAAADKALAGRCLRIAGAMGHQTRDPRESLGLFERADAVLSGGADDALRAEVANEIAVCHLNLGNGEDALAAAERAYTLATQTGNGSIGRMARGNVANALLRLRRPQDALEIFVGLEEDQLAAGEVEMAGVTRQNIDGIQAFLQRRG